MSENEEFNEEEYNEELETFREIKKLRQGYESAFVKRTDLHEKEEVYDWALDTDMNPDWNNWEKELNMTEREFPQSKKFFGRKKK
jgi:hypothetical protein